MNIEDVKKYLQHCMNRAKEDKKLAQNFRVSEYLSGKQNMCSQALVWIVEKKYLEHKGDE